jgi:hypothetical protein
MKRTIIGTVAALALGLVPGAGAAVSVRIPLASHVRIDKTPLTLADLLPAAAPERLRSESAGISLGSAPLPGSQRQLSRAEIEGLLGARLAGELQIPEAVVVERVSRELSRRQVFAAIRTSLVRNGFRGAGELTAKDVQFGMPVRVTAEDPGLQVVGMRLDPTLHLAVFRLWTAKEARVRPFDVMVQPVAGLEQWLERTAGGGRLARRPARLVRTTARSGAHPRTIWRARKPRGKPLVMPWQTASLLLISGTMEIHTTVEPLARGYLGQLVRVRMSQTKQIFLAQVVAPDCLEARF